MSLRIEESVFLGSPSSPRAASFSPKYFPTTVPSHKFPTLTLIQNIHDGGEIKRLKQENDALQAQLDDAKAEIKRWQSHHDSLQREQVGTRVKLEAAKSQVQNALSTKEHLQRSTKLKVAEIAERAFQAEKKLNSISSETDEIKTKAKRAEEETKFMIQKSLLALTRSCITYCDQLLHKQSNLTEMKVFLKSKEQSFIDGVTQEGEKLSTSQTIDQLQSQLHAMTSLRDQYHGQMREMRKELNELRTQEMVRRKQAEHENASQKAMSNKFGGEPTVVVTVKTLAHIKMIFDQLRTLRKSQIAKVSMTAVRLCFDQVVTAVQVFEKSMNERVNDLQQQMNEVNQHFKHMESQKNTQLLTLRRELGVANDAKKSQVAQVKQAMQVSEMKREEMLAEYQNVATRYEELQVQHNELLQQVASINVAIDHNNESNKEIAMEIKSILQPHKPHALDSTRTDESVDHLLRQCVAAVKDVVTRLAAKTVGKPEPKITNVVKKLVPSKITSSVKSNALPTPRTPPLELTSPPVISLTPPATPLTPTLRTWVAPSESRVDIPPKAVVCKTVVVKTVLRPTMYVPPPLPASTDEVIVQDRIVYQPQEPLPPPLCDTEIFHLFSLKQVVPRPRPRFTDFETLYSMPPQEIVAPITPQVVEKKNLTTLRMALMTSHKPHQTAAPDNNQSSLSSTELTSQQNSYPTITNETNMRTSHNNFTASPRRDDTFITSSKQYESHVTHPPSRGTVQRIKDKLNPTTTSSTSTVTSKTQTSQGKPHPELKQLPKRQNNNNVVHTEEQQPTPEMKEAGMYSGPAKFHRDGPITSHKKSTTPIVNGGGAMNVSPMLLPPQNGLTPSMAEEVGTGGRRSPPSQRRTEVVPYFSSDVPTSRPTTQQHSSSSVVIVSRMATRGSDFILASPYHPTYVHVPTSPSRLRDRSPPTAQVKALPHHQEEEVVEQGEPVPLLYTMFPPVPHGTKLHREGGGGAGNMSKPVVMKSHLRYM